MNYDLCKRLKEAGFPQPHFTGFNDGMRLTHWYTAYIPTLSELMAECGDSLEGIARKKNGVRTNWYAFGIVKIIDSFITDVDGDSIEEAVANFYLLCKSNE